MVDGGGAITLARMVGRWERLRWDRDRTGRRMRQLLGTNAQVLQLARRPAMVHMLASMVDDRA